MVGGPFFDFSCYCFPLFSVSSSIVARGSFAFRFGFASPPLSSSATPSGPIVSNFRRSTLTNLHLAYRWYLPGLLDEPRQPMQNRLAILIGTGEWVRCNTTGGSCSERGDIRCTGGVGAWIDGRSDELCRRLCCGRYEFTIIADLDGFFSGRYYGVNFVCFDSVFC